MKIINNIKWFIRILFIAKIKKRIYCSFIHKKRRCYPPEIGGFKTWHCKKCWPCSNEIDILLETKI